MQLGYSGKIGIVVPQENAESKLSKGPEEADSGTAEQNFRISVRFTHNLTITVFMLHPFEFAHGSTRGRQQN